MVGKGEHIKSWGVSGTDQGEFNLPHSISLLAVPLPGEGTGTKTVEWHVLVADRESQRVQAFTVDGTFLYEKHAHRAVAVQTIPTKASAAAAKASIESNSPIDSYFHEAVIIAEQGTTSGVQRGTGFHGAAALDSWTKNIGHRICAYKHATFTRSEALHRQSKKKD